MSYPPPSGELEGASFIPSGELEGALYALSLKPAAIRYFRLLN